MTNKQRQKSLDKRKWIASETLQRDLSGFMFWCETCQHYGNCTIPQAERERNTICATAYNRMQRRGKRC